MAVEIFVDTSGWASYFLKREAFHAQASEIIRVALPRKVRPITTNYVVAELASLLLSPLRLPWARRVESLEKIRLARWLDILHIGKQGDDDAWDLLKTRPDKDWSLVDCSSFVVMRGRGITDALTNDRHFEQAGFNRLLA